MTEWLIETLKREIAAEEIRITRAPFFTVEARKRKLDLLRGQLADVLASNAQD